MLRRTITGHRLVCSTTPGWRGQWALRCELSAGMHVIWPLPGGFELTGEIGPGSVPEDQLEGVDIQLGMFVAHDRVGKDAEGRWCRMMTPRGGKTSVHPLPPKVIADLDRKVAIALASVEAALEAEAKMAEPLDHSEGQH